MSAPLSRIVTPQLSEYVDAATSGVAMSPISFGGRFGWLHQPQLLADGAAGVVLVSPLGRDARCAHRPFRLFADRLAHAGYPVLRFDQLNHGDSADLADDGDALPGWFEGVRAATSFLKDVSGVRRVVLGGARMGATLAAIAADRDVVDGLILFAPVVSGKAWVRELRLAGALGGTASEAAHQAGGLEADGLTLSPATVRSLSALDLQSTPLSARQVLLLAQNKSVAALGAHLTAHGASVTLQEFAGYDPLFEDAHSNQAPEEAFAQALQWIKTALPIDRDGMVGTCPHPPACRLDLPGVVEVPVTFGAGLQGIITRPDELNAARRAVVFLNTGGDPRAGIGRFAVWAARALARRGVASMRFDFPGVGDSADPADGRRHVYEVARTEDIRGALELMSANGFEDLTLTGICAGGLHASRAAFDSLGVRKVLMVSPVKLVWRPGDSLAVGKRDQGRATSFYMNGLANAATWKRLITGDIHVMSVLKTLGRRMIGRLAARRDDTTRVFREQIAATSAKGVRIRVLVGVDDASLDEVETYFGPKGAAMNQLPGMSVRVAPQLDHGLARSESRVVALDELIDLVEQA